MIDVSRRIADLVKEMIDVKFGLKTGIGPDDIGIKFNRLIPRDVRLDVKATVLDSQTDSDSVYFFEEMINNLGRPLERRLRYAIAEMVGDYSFTNNQDVMDISSMLQNASDSDREIAQNMMTEMIGDISVDDVMHQVRSEYVDEVLEIFQTYTNQEIKAHLEKNPERQKNVKRDVLMQVLEFVRTFVDSCLCKKDNVKYDDHELFEMWKELPYELQKTIATKQNIDMIENLKSLKKIIKVPEYVYELTNEMLEKLEKEHKELKKIPIFVSEKMYDGEPDALQGYVDKKLGKGAVNVEDLLSGVRDQAVGEFMDLLSPAVWKWETRA